MGGKRLSERRSPLERQAGETAAFSRDQAFTMLSNRRRRWVLHYLERHDGGPVDVRGLVETLTAWEQETTIEDVSWKERKRVYTALRQSHLPKLADFGAIEYDSNRGTVELTESAQTLQLYLEYVPERDIPWYQYYLGLAGVGTFLTVVTWASLPPFDGLGGMMLATILTVMVLVSALAHTYHARQSRLGATAEPPP